MPPSVRQGSNVKWWIGIGLAASLAGCGSGDERERDAGGDRDSGDDVDAGDVAIDPCGFGDVPVATIAVSEIAGVYSEIGAILRDGPEPSFHQSVEEGSCRHLRLEPGFCDPACTGGEACTIDGECRPYPERISGGTLTVTGLGDPIEIEPEDWSPGTYIGPATLPADLFDEETVVGASLAGDVFPGLYLRARGVASIDTDLRETGFVMRGGADAELTWTPGPDPDACVQFVLNGRNQRHGAPLEDIIRCEGPDTGSLVVPRALVEAFPIGETPEITEGYDWPQSELTRYTRSTQDVEPGPAALVVRSTTFFRLHHPK